MRRRGGTQILQIPEESVEGPKILQIPEESVEFGLTKSNSTDQDRMCGIWNATTTKHPNQILQIPEKSVEFGRPKMCRIWAGSPATPQNL